MKKQSLEKQIEKTADLYNGYITLAGLMVGLLATTKVLTYGYMIAARFLLCMGFLVISVVMIRYDDELRRLTASVPTNEQPEKIKKIPVFLICSLLLLSAYLFIPGFPLIAQGFCIGTATILLLRCRVQWILTHRIKSKRRRAK